MGNYVFSTRTLVEAVQEDALDAGSAHDMGGNIVTNLVSSGDAAVYDYSTNHVPGTTARDVGYWRDVGTIDSYYDAQMDPHQCPPHLQPLQRGMAHSHRPTFAPASWRSSSSTKKGAGASPSTRWCAAAAFFPAEPSGVRSFRQASWCTRARRSEGSVLMTGVDTGRGAVVRHAIIDKNVKIPPGCTIGVDREQDRRRGLTISEGGVVVIGKGDTITVDLTAGKRSSGPPQGSLRHGRAPSGARTAEGLSL